MTKTAKDRSAASGDTTFAVEMTQAATIRRVLVLDDSPVQLKITTTVLRGWGLEVWDCQSGAEALELADRIQPDLVISDWMMPGMDGPEFCRRFRSARRERYAYVILLTSRQGADQVAQGLDAGADDFMAKPIRPDELRARINAGARILAMERELQEKNRVISDKMDELVRFYDALEQDLEQARAIQMSLVPDRSRTVPGGQVGVLLHPCGQVGGDLVGIVSATDGNIGFYNVDVSGHGITSALIASRVAGYLSDAFPQQSIALVPSGEGYALRPPEEIADALNRRMTSDAGVGEYLTMLMATVDMGTGHLRFVQAGHPPPLLLRADGTREFIGSSGLPIGILPGARFQAEEAQLHPGDRLLIYSDGFTECPLPGGKMLDRPGLLELIGEIPASQGGTEFLDDLYWRLCARRGGDGTGTEMEDDISAVLFEFGATPPDHPA